MTDSLSAVIYNGGGRPARPCPVHRRPIAPGTLFYRLWVRDQIQKRHVDHYMPEAGCPSCFTPGGQVER